MKARFSLHILAAFLVLLTVSVAAQAQAIRTWVSGVGDDANPCSRTAPCKTFAGAISKTAVSGEINVLDPAGFGTVTITKSITISAEGLEGGISAAGTNGIIVNAASTDVVVLRGLDIDGFGTGLNGIRVLAAGVVHVEKCTINHFTQKAIDFEPASASAATSQLYVIDSNIRNNPGGGIFIKPGANVSATAMVENAQLGNNLFGIRAEDNSKVTAKNTSATGGNSGFVTVSSSAVVTMNLDKCVSTGNFSGIRADGTNATIRITGCLVAGNTNGLVTNLGVGTGHIVSFLNNYNADSGTPNGPNINPQ